jgi:tetratricopeptide (TPR) repeat protein
MAAWNRREADRAAVEWRKAAKADARDPELWVMIGRAELVSGHADRALEAWEEALKREPEYKGALFERGKEGLGRHIARRLGPPLDQGSGWLPLGLEPTGRVEGGTEERRRVEADLRAGAEHAPEFMKFARGALYLLEGRFREAMPELQAYTDLNGWDATAIALLGIAGRYAALPKQSEQALSQALALRDEKLWQRVRAEARYLQGNYDASRADYRDAGVEKDAEPLFARRIPSQGLVVWLKADTGVETSDDAVARWADQSGAKNDATKKERSPGPRLAASALRGRPAILFSGKDDDLRLPDGFEDFSAGLSVFVVGETPTEAGEPWSFIDLGTAGTGTSGMKVAFGRVRESEQVVYSVEDVQFQMKPFVEAMAPAKGFEGISAIQEPSKTVRLYKRGQPLANGTLLVPRKTNRKINRVGGGFKGQLAEILLYKRSLSELERLGVEAYLKDRYFPDGGAAPAPAEKR